MARCFKKNGEHYKLVVELENGSYIFPEKSITKDDNKQIYGVTKVSDNTINVYYSDDTAEEITDKTIIEAILKNVRNRLCKKK